MNPCKKCGHPAESHDEEFGTCGHLGVSETGWDVCECEGYEEMELEDMPCVERVQ